MLTKFKIGLAIMVIAFAGMICVMPNTPLVEAADPRGPFTMTTQTGNSLFGGGFCIGLIVVVLIFGVINLAYYKNRGGGLM